MPSPFRAAHRPDQDRIGCFRRHHRFVAAKCAVRIPCAAVQQVLAELEPQLRTIGSRIGESHCILDNLGTDAVAAQCQDFVFDHSVVPVVVLTNHGRIILPTRRCVTHYSLHELVAGGGEQPAHEPVIGQDLLDYSSHL